MIDSSSSTFQTSSLQIPYEAVCFAQNQDLIPIAMIATIAPVETTKDNQNKKNRSINICNILSRYSFSQEIKLFADLSVTSEGVVRMCSALHNNSLGYFPTTCEQVTLHKDINIMNLRFVQRLSPFKHSTNDAIQFLSHFPEAETYTILLKEKDLNFQTIKDEINELYLSQQLLENKDKEFNAFNEYCFNYLKEHKESSSSMYSYIICRVSLSQKDVDFSNAGYSTGLLELLGIDKESLTQLSLRNKKIDLIINRSVLIQQSIQILFGRTQNHHEYESSFEIITFDGCLIRITAKLHTIKIPLEFAGVLKSHEEYAFAITEVDVDVENLKKLILYRQRLIKSSKIQGGQLSLDTFIQKELSYKFEDIEYSILSEKFIDRYYTENVEALQEIERNKTLFQNQCKYRLIK